jgi:hypothetical protein
MKNKSKKVLRKTLFTISLVLVVLPLISAVSISDSTQGQNLVLNTSVSNSSMTFSIGMNVGNLTIKNNNITMYDINCSNGKHLDSFNWDTPNSNIDSSDFCTAPNTTIPIISPAIAYTINDLVCNATLTDPEQVNLTAYWTWYKNGVSNLSGILFPVTNGTNTIITTLLSGNTTKGENWTCEVIPSINMTINGTAKNSTRTIQNSPPVINVTEPNGINDITNSLYNTTWTTQDNDSDIINISCYGDEDNLDYNKTYTCFENSTDDGSELCNMSQWTSGDYYIWCNATDGEDYGLDYSQGQVTIDKIKPTIEIISPNNQTYNYSTILLNISANDSYLDTIWYNWNGTNYTYTTSINITFAEGLNILYAWANDTAENENSTNVTFSVDTTLPTSNSPPDAQYCINASATIGWILYDENEGNYYVTRNGTIVNSSSWTNGTNLDIPINTSTQGFWNYTIYFNDSAGNKGIPDEVIIEVVFNNAPTVSLNAPENNSFTTQNEVLLNATVYDLDIENMTVWFYGDDSLLSTSYNQTNGTEITYNWTGLSEGIHNWTVIANDCLENSTIEYYYFTKDTTGPGITIVSPQNTTYNNATILVNLSTIDTGSGVNTVWFYNGTNNETYTGEAYRTFSEGNNTLIAYANDTVGNENSTSVTFSIDTGAPTVNITYPQNITYNINVSELNYTASNGGSGLEKCWYSTDDGGTNSTPVTPGTN